MKWPEVEIRQIAQVVSGFGFPRKYQGDIDEEFPFFKVGDMNSLGNERCMAVVVNTISAVTLKKLKAKAFPPGTIIFPKIGAAIATNKKRMLTQPSVVDNNVMGFIPNDLIDKWYLYYWMQQFDLRSVTNIGPVPSMRKTEVEKVRIPLPTPTEQRRIVEILDQADALRKKRAEADAKADRTLPALFYKMFGDPATNPKGLRKTPIKKIVLRPDRRNPNERPDEHFKYVDIAGINGEVGTIVVTKRLIGSDAPSRARQIVKAKDIIVSTVRPYLRATAIVPNELDNQICSTGFCVLRPKEGFGYGFIYALSRLPWFTEQLNMRARGASYPAVTDADILNLQIPCSADETQLKGFDQWVDYIIESQHSRRDVYRRLEDLFAVLLHRAYTGDLTATWREAHMKELLEEMEQQARELELRKNL